MIHFYIPCKLLKFKNLILHIFSKCRSPYIISLLKKDFSGIILSKPPSPLQAHRFFMGWGQTSSPTSRCFFLELSAPVALIFSAAWRHAALSHHSSSFSTPPQYFLSCGFWFVGVFFHANSQLFLKIVEFNWSCSTTFLMILALGHSYLATQLFHSATSC